MATKKTSNGLCQKFEFEGSLKIHFLRKRNLKMYIDISLKEGECSI